MTTQPDDQTTTARPVNRNIPLATRAIRIALGNPGVEDVAKHIAYVLQAAGLLVDSNTEVPATVAARELAAQIQETHGRRPEFQGVQADKDEVLITLHVGTLAEWYAWWEICGINSATLTAMGSVPYAERATGRRDGITVHLIAHGVPSLIRRAFGEPETIG